MINNKNRLEYGLTSREIEERVEAGLVNGEVVIKTKSVKRILIDNIFTLFNLINTVLVISVFMVGSYKNMLFYLIVLFNTLIGIIQELRAKMVIDKLSILSAPKTRVLRDGKVESIELKDIVMDEVMVLKSGNQVCTDACIAQGECEVDESLLTGESNPIFKAVGDEILSGSFIVSGSIKAIANHLGHDNYVNKITAGAKYLKKPNSEIMRSTKFIIKVNTICIIPISIILFIKQMFFVGQGIDRAVVSTVAAISSMIPGGLMLLTSVALAVSVIKLAMHKTLAQDLYCTEALARVDVLCLDKTGTITDGTMEIEGIHPLNGAGEKDIEDFLTLYADALDDENATFISIKEKYGKGNSKDCDFTIPFSSHNKWSLAFYEGEGSLILGASEFILKGKVEEYGDLIDEYSSDGHRVLMFARSEFKPDDRNLPSKVQPIALILINEKIRDSAKDTLEYFYEEDVDVRIISGDNSISVANIAKRAGVKGSEKYIDMSTVETKEEIFKAARDYIVFGRVTPYQKLELIKALKEQGHTVAMTGDGVNDVLALKESDCSIAMQSGSDAARNTSQLVLMDSNFSSMPKIVEEGRRTINNLQRSAALYLVKTVYASLMALIFVFVAFQYPFVPIQITLIGAFSIGMPSFLLAFEPNKDRIKEHFLRNVFRMSIPGGLLIVTNILTVVILADLFNMSNIWISTVATYSTEIASLIVLFTICSPMNWIKGVFAILICGGYLFTALVFNSFFDIARPNPFMVALLVVLGLLSFLIYYLYRKVTCKIMDKFYGRGLHIKPE